MLCPVCQEEMETGVLQGGNILLWAKKRHYISLLPREEDVVLNRNYLTGAKLNASICKKCRIVMAEYEEITDF